jgi:DNA-binding NarL/FixJ family response regulator
MMPGLGGLEVTRQVAKKHPNTRVVVLSMHATEAYVIEALRNGASAYVLKDADAGDLLRAIREAVEGRRFLSPPLTDAAVAAYARRAAGAEPADSYEQLTTREREVLHLTAEGLTNADVGERLFISPRTAETHRANVMRKLGLSNQTDLVRYAIGRGIVAPR